MNEVARVMLLIKTVDPDASLKLSEYTGKWYIEARIEVGDGAILRGCTEHRDTPGEAVLAYFDNLRMLKVDEYIVGRYLDQRREYRWNGAAFVEQTRPEAMR